MTRIHNALVYVAAAVLVLLLVRELVSAEPAMPEWVPECWCRVEVTSVHDADTVVGSVILPFGNLVIRNKAIRAGGFDAWEVSRNRRTLKLTDEQWKVEIVRGLKAKQEFEELLRGGVLYISPVPESKDIDPYDRIDAYWLVVKDGVGYRVEVEAARRGWVRK